MSEKSVTFKEAEKSPSLLAQETFVRLSSLLNTMDGNVSKALPIELAGFSEHEREAFRQRLYRICWRAIREFVRNQEDKLLLITPATKFRGDDLLVWFEEKE